MNVRLAFAIISTLLEEIALVLIVRLVLPQFGVYLPPAGLIALMVVLGGYAVVTYRVVSRALKKKPAVDLPVNIGSRGKVVSPLAPEGMVKIKNELWVAKAARGNIDNGEEVMVVSYDGLSLVVSRSNTGDDEEGAE